MLCELLAAELALSPHRGDARSDTLLDQVHLESSESREHMKIQFAARGGGVDIVAKAAEMDTAPLRIRGGLIEAAGLGTCRWIGRGLLSLACYQIRFSLSAPSVTWALSLIGIRERGLNGPEIDLAIDPVSGSKPMASTSIS
jgi:hypothetical protein